MGGLADRGRPVESVRPGFAAVVASCGIVDLRRSETRRGRTTWEALFTLRERAVRLARRIFLRARARGCSRRTVKTSWEAFTARQGGNKTPRNGPRPAMGEFREIPVRELGSARYRGAAREAFFSLAIPGCGALTAAS